MQGRRGSPAERRKCALTAPDTSADLHCSAPFSALADINSILSAVRKLERSSGWKTGVQRITTDRLRFAISLRRQILTGTYRQQEENIFTVSERGHRRLIRALAPADMVLQHEDLVAEVINWDPKTVNIKQLAIDLNIGLDAFVYLDDNPAEREQMKGVCPEVAVIDLVPPQEPPIIAPADAISSSI